MITILKLPYSKIPLFWFIKTFLAMMEKRIDLKAAFHDSFQGWRHRQKSRESSRCGRRAPAPLRRGRSPGRDSRGRSPARPGPARCGSPGRSRSIRGTPSQKAASTSSRFELSYKKTEQNHTRLGSLLQRNWFCLLSRTQELCSPRESTWKSTKTSQEQKPNEL